ncbi:NADPH:quinone oxidoreductase 2 [Nitrincola lacisaponensis]|uniref:NADPH:quinone oxidoreductase 2 n=1 Tax=Nitrincola lacisaponensis TaxID=267850 RepID=A0A063Y9N6_9GAMM|nr:SDR family oxidoreductase [Nitrincola lacisaponensis]KDE41032.1 NADPH:quinone oxidoreductase 2 [Nitrincola lacisaponensis]
MILVTGASGQLGRLVLEQLLQHLPASQLAAGVRTPERVADLQARGVTIRPLDYSQPETLPQALEGVETLLLISSSEVGQRAVQHQNVITAAEKAGVKRLVYTSLLHADTSPLGLAEEHKQTEARLKASSLEWVILRNGWYTENYLASLPAALEHHVLIGCAGKGRITSATRQDYASAAATVLQEGATHNGKIYELAGDTSYSLEEYAAEITRLSGQEVRYQNLSENEFRDALIQAGLPEGFAALLADSDAGASQGALFDDSLQLSQLIKRPTTPLTEALQQALESLPVPAHN